MSVIWDSNSEPKHRTPQEIQALRDWQLLWADEREALRLTKPEYVKQQDERRSAWETHQQYLDHEERMGNR